MASLTPLDKETKHFYYDVSNGNLPVEGVLKVGEQEYTYFFPCNFILIFVIVWTLKTQQVDITSPVESLTTITTLLEQEDKASLKMEEDSASFSVGPLLEGNVNMENR